MLKTKRIKQIEEYVYEHETVSLDELVKTFDVSKNTIRRDVRELVSSGMLKKVYGGVSVNHTMLESFTERKTRHQSQKRLIAQKAANYIEDGDTIFIDSGTTTLEMADFLQTKQLNIITNNLDFITKAVPYPNLKVISTGGVLERETKSFVNFTKSNPLETHNIDKAFMATTGISLMNGVTNSSPLETEMKQTAVQKSPIVFLLVDHHKFDKQAVMTYCHLNEIDYLITDIEPAEPYQNCAMECHLKLVVANK